MQLKSVIFTILATAATLINAAPVPVENSDLEYCARLFEGMGVDEARPSDDLSICTDYWNKALVDCGYKADQETKLGTVPEEYKSCFEEMFLKYKSQSSVMTRRNTIEVRQGGGDNDGAGAGAGASAGFGFGASVGVGANAGGGAGA